jgi:hypothetical protein
MKPTHQLGAHPDAESLTAFAEQLLSGTEREQILAHMATCNRCREVVFLTQRMMEPEKLASATEPQESVRPTPRGWFGGWRWAWVPTAALAGFIGFAVLQHQRRAAVSQPEMAQNVSPPETVRNATPAKTVATPSVQQQAPRREETKGMSAARRRADRDAEVSSGALDRKDKATQKKDELAKESDLLSAVAPDVSGESAHRKLSARAKSSTIGGPMTQNQAQQQNNAPPQQQNYANEVRPTGTLFDSADKPVPASVPPGGASESVTVQAEQGPILASATPATAPEIATAPKATQSVVLSNMKTARLTEGRSALPSELGILSEAKAAKTRIAIDTAGALFLSEDGGKHWQPVKAQWTGRAVLLKVRPMTGVSGGILRQSTAQFRLTTDKLETWISEDGKTWTLETPVAK